MIRKPYVGMKVKLSAACRTTSQTSWCGKGEAKVVDYHWPEGCTTGTITRIRGATGTYGGRTFYVTPDHPEGVGEVSFRAKELDCADTPTEPQP